MEKFYFTAHSSTSGLQLGNLHDRLDSGNWATQPKLLDDGDLYRVTIEKVGVVRSVKEVEMDGEGN